MCLLVVLTYILYIATRACRSLTDSVSLASVMFVCPQLIIFTTPTSILCECLFSLLSQKFCQTTPPLGKPGISFPQLLHSATRRATYNTVDSGDILNRDLVLVGVLYSRSIGAIVHAPR